MRINGEPVDEFEFGDGRGANFVRQENNLTWQAELPETNKVQAGEWWGEDYQGEIQVSLDKHLADGLGIGVGDTMTFNVGGEEFDAPVTSLRSIEWDSMQPNFYVVFSPGDVQRLPQTYIASIYVEPKKRILLNRFVREFPSVTVFDLEVILGQVRMVIDRASMAVQYVFLFTLLAGVMVLLAAIQATRDERRFESALLHTLGASRRKILQGHRRRIHDARQPCRAHLPHSARPASAMFSRPVFSVSTTSSARCCGVAGVAGGCIVVGVTGTLATRKAVNEPPVVVLRDA